MQQCQWPVSEGAYECVALLSRRFPRRRARRHRRFTARQSNAATHRITSDVRSFDALATEMPTPLKIATYDATQMGHLGSKISVVPGMIHRAISPPRRQRDARPASVIASWRRCLKQQWRGVHLPVSAVWQHEPAFCEAASYSSWRRNQMSVSFRPKGARSSHWYIPQRSSNPRAYAE